MRRNKGESLAAVMVSITVFGLLSVFFLQFYLLLIQAQDRITAHSDTQRVLRQLVFSLSREMRESSSALPTDSPLLVPNSTTTSSSEIRFTHVVNPNDFDAPTFQTVRYYYNSTAKAIYRQIVGQTATRIICRNISSATFYYVNSRTARLAFTVSVTVRGANHANQTLTSSGELYVFSRLAVR